MLQYMIFLFCIFVIKRLKKVQYVKKYSIFALENEENIFWRRSFNLSMQGLHISKDKFI